MQGEFDTQYPGLSIELIGVNEVGHDSANDQMCDGRDIPWLQDTSAGDWWGAWSPTYRDVVILDGAGELAGVYNLTDHPLTDEANYVELKAMIVEIAEAE